ncbi:hypothetical protein PIIN_04764 [Serendipita indica DSM 11827]|uniref:Uncharacterized protein n=1 Tax=Serendipita indica (strain DSM 11827) TaxID=1109443 RepID=G4THN6_SERID|nr:hypothetical protein PIIN_04764 [Serendipita indica DSM 11827]
MRLPTAHRPSYQSTPVLEDINHGQQPPRYGIRLGHCRVVEATDERYHGNKDVEVSIPFHSAASSNEVIRVQLPTP